MIIPTETPHQLAAELADLIKSIPQFLMSIMRRAYQITNTPGMEQAILDALPAFGITAKYALSMYALIRSMLVTLGLDVDLPEANADKFVANADGSVTVVIPERPDPSILTSTEP
jgi:hypothetical protein